MTDNESFLASLGVTDAVPPLPDQVWEQMLAVALDPTTPSADSDLVPEQDDVPIELDGTDGDDIVLHHDDDTDDNLTSTVGHTIADTAAPHEPAPHDDPHRHDFDDQPLLIDDAEPGGNADHVDEHADRHVDIGHVDVGDDYY